MQVRLRTLDLVVYWAKIGCVVNGTKNSCKRIDQVIEFLELFALAAGILTWEDHPLLNNRRVIIFCDNQAVVSMVNNITSSCKNCMILLRLLVLNSLIHNQRLFVHYVRSRDNGISDALSRLQWDRFRKLAPNMNKLPHQVDQRIWPLEKIWLN